MAARPSDFKRTKWENERVQRETAAAREAFDAFMRNRVSEHRALCARFHIPSAPVEIPPSAIELLSREA